MTLADAPKAELHVHLFGAIPPQVLRDLARRKGVELPSELAMRYRDFDHLAETFRALRPLVTTAGELELITYELGRELAAQCVRYVEVMTTPGAVAARGIDYPEQISAMNRARERARTDFDIEIRWIFDIPRSGVGGDSARYWAEYTTEAAIDGLGRGVVALGLSGPEAGHPPEEFAPWFERARAAGLHSVPHAGEHAGPQSVWGALHALGADRIAHGVRAVEDPELIAYLAKNGIALDVCPTSNVCLGVYPSLADHPLRQLHESGVPITVNSDDPTMFGTTLNEEVAALTGPLGLSEAAAAEIVANGFRFALDWETAA